MFCWQMVSAVALPYRFRHRLISQSGWLSLAASGSEVFFSFRRGSGMVSFRRLTALSSPLTKPVSHLGCFISFKAWTVSLIAAEAGTRSRKRSWNIPTRNACSVRLFILDNGCFENFSTTQSRYPRQRITPYTRDIINCLSRGSPRLIFEIYCSMSWSIGRRLSSHLQRISIVM